MGFFDELQRCVTKIPRRSDGTDECEHLMHEHEDDDCQFCPCQEFIPGEDSDEDEDAS